MDRVVVISGGGTGRGRAIARSFALDGDRCLILGRRVEVLEETAEKLNAQVGTEHVRWRDADLSIPEQVESVREGLRAVDMIVNAAGGVDRSRTSTLSEVRDAWLRDLSGNLLSAVQVKGGALFGR